jgi:riboflavin kinase
MEGQVYKMVTSIGWNPHFQLEKKTVEPHLIHPFEQDFYGKTLSIIVFAFLRPEQKYDSMGK